MCGPDAQIAGLRRVSVRKAVTAREIMAASASFEDFYVATINRLLQQREIQPLL
jgi:hypothetical protein